MEYSDQIAGLRALIAGSKQAAERAKHDLADSLARIAEAERIIGEMEELQKQAAGAASH